MTLPSPGVPFQSGQTISSAQVNATLTDLATEIGSSLDRSGRGGALAPIRGVDGTAATPSISFTAEPASGIYRAGATDVRLTVGGVDALKLVSGGLSGALTFAAGAALIQTTVASTTVQLKGNANAADPDGVDVTVLSTTDRTAGYLATFNNGTVGRKLRVDYNGLLTLGTPATAIQPASVWTAITPNAGWTAGGGLGYWKDAGGVVHLKGSVQYATGATSPAFTLPAGFRPASTRSWAMYSVSQGLAAAFHINADGTSTGDNAVNGFSYALDAVTFLAEQ